MMLKLSLGVIAGVFLLVPKGVVMTVLLWGVAKVNPVLRVTLFGVWALVERWPHHGARDPAPAVDRSSLVHKCTLQIFTGQCFSGAVDVIEPAFSADINGCKETDQPLGQRLIGLGQLRCGVVEDDTARR